MSNELQKIDEREVLGKVFRIYGDKENPLFLAKDVATWIENTNTSQMVKNVDKEEKVKKIAPIYNVYNGQYENQECLFLTEDGLYEVLMQSRKSIAREFKKEVKKILKQIRLTGGAVNDEEEFIKNYFPSFSEEVKQAMVLDLKHQNEKIKKELAEKERFINQISASTGTVLMRDVALLASKQGLKIGAKTLWAKCREWKLVDRNNKPYQQFLNQGLFEVVEYVINTSSGTKLSFTTKVTGKGQVYIIKKLLSLNV